MHVCLFGSRHKVVLRQVLQIGRSLAGKMARLLSRPYMRPRLPKDPTSRYLRSVSLKKATECDSNSPRTTGVEIPPTVTRTLYVLKIVSPPGAMAIRDNNSHVLKVAQADGTCQTPPSYRICFPPVDREMQPALGAQLGYSNVRRV